MELSRNACKSCVPDTFSGSNNTFMNCSKQIEKYQVYLYLISHENYLYVTVAAMAATCRENVL